MARVYLNLKCAEDNTFHFQMGGEKFHAPCACGWASSRRRAAASRPRSESSRGGCSGP